MLNFFLNRNIKTKLISLCLLIILQVAEAGELPVMVGIGGSFSVLDSEGKPFTQDNLKGYTNLLAFGYSNCADICPFTLGYMRKVYDKLTPELQQQTQFIFVSVDPEYDNPEHLKSFLAHFNNDFVGLTGSKEAIDRIVANYQVTYKRLANEKVQTKFIRRVEEKKAAQTGSAQKNNDEAKPDSGYLYSHSVHLFLIDKDGQTRGIAHTGTPENALVADLQGLIEEAPGQKDRSQ